MTYMRRFMPATTLGRVFAAISVFLIIALIATYVHTVREALSMDPASYECTDDSMMRQICEDPYGTSVFWSIIFFGLYCWPGIIAWIVSGLVLLNRRRKSAHNTHSAK